MEQSDEKKYWTWKKMLAAIGIVLVLAMVKVFTGPPPPGKSSWREPMNDSSANRESKHLAKQIKKYPRETKFLENEIREAILSKEEQDIKLLEELTQKAMNLLPEDEKQQLIALQVRFNENGYGALTENEINTMQTLNKKAFDLLPAEDKVKLNKVFRETEEITTDVVLKDRLKALVDNLDHSDVAVRWKAIEELEKLGPKAKEVVHDIIPYLDSNDWRVRYYAAEILGMIGLSAKPAVPALQKALNDPDEKVRVRASWALDQISKDNQRNNNGR